MLFLGIHLNFFVEFEDEAVWQLDVIAYEALQVALVLRLDCGARVGRGELARRAAWPSLHLDGPVEFHFYGGLSVYHALLLFLDCAALRLDSVGVAGLVVFHQVARHLPERHLLLVNSAAIEIDHASVRFHLRILLELLGAEAA